MYINLVTLFIKSFEHRFLKLGANGLGIFCNPFSCCCKSLPDKNRESSNNCNIRAKKLSIVHKSQNIIDKFVEMLNALQNLFTSTIFANHSIIKV